MKTNPYNINNCIQYPMPILPQIQYQYPISNARIASCPISISNIQCQYCLTSNINIQYPMPMLLQIQYQYPISNAKIASRPISISNIQCQYCLTSNINIQYPMPMLPHIQYQCPIPNSQKSIGANTIPITNSILLVFYWYWYWTIVLGPMPVVKKSLPAS